MTTAPTVESRVEHHCPCGRTYTGPPPLDPVIWAWWMRAHAPHGFQPAEGGKP